MSRAIRLAEAALGRKVQPPVAFDMEQLLPRVEALAKGDALMTAQLFFEIYRGLREEKFNAFVREHFSEDVLYRMYCAGAEDMSSYSILEDWLLLGLPFRGVARMLVTDPEGPRQEPETFVKTILKAKLHIEDKLTYDAVNADNANEEPDDVGMLFARMAAMMFGIRNWAIDCYIPLEQLKADCEAVFGDRCDVEALFRDTAAELEADENRQAVEKLYDTVDERAEECAEYDIWAMRDMFDWTPKKTVSPELFHTLEEFLAKAYEVTADIREAFRKAGRDERLRMLTGYGGKKVLLSKKRWDKIFSKVMDDEKMVRYITLFGIQFNSDSFSEMARVLLYNDKLYSKVWRRAIK